MRPAQLFHIYRSTQRRPRKSFFPLDSARSCRECAACSRWQGISADPSTEACKPILANGEEVSVMDNRLWMQLKEKMFSCVGFDELVKLTIVGVADRHFGTRSSFMKINERWKITLPTDTGMKKVLNFGLVWCKRRLRLRRIFHINFSTVARNKTHKIRLSNTFYFSLRFIWNS